MTPAQESAEKHKGRQSDVPRPSTANNGSTSSGATASTQPDASKGIADLVSSPDQIHRDRLLAGAWWYTSPASAGNYGSRSVRIVSIPGRRVEAMAPATQAPIVKAEREPQATWKDRMMSFWSPHRGTETG
ncbi:hypothetical protein N7512_006924 [Penicillium capsulatum]|nr:hypothetical protein N7512_006924 [Penicillium capsulatum]